MPKRSAASKKSYNESAREDDDETDTTTSSNPPKVKKIRRKKRPKVTELMTPEQKREVETYYKVDMSVVDGSLVTKNMTQSGPKAFKCNVCKTSYERLDKCQVKI